MTTKISQTRNGIIYTCGACDKVHFEYKNLNFRFSNSEFRSFSDYLLKLDGAYWENKNQHSRHQRKIFIPIGHQNLKLAFNSSEIEELKSLVNKEEETFQLRNFALNYTYSNN